MQTEILQL